MSLAPNVHCIIITVCVHCPPHGEIGEFDEGTDLISQCRYQPIIREASFAFFSMGSRAAYGNKETISLKLTVPRGSPLFPKIAPDAGCVHAGCAALIGDLKGRWMAREQFPDISLLSHGNTSNDPAASVGFG